MPKSGILAKVITCRRDSTQRRGKSPSVSIWETVLATAMCWDRMHRHDPTCSIDHDYARL